MIYKSKFAQDEPYEPQDGHHRFSAAPAWCENIDPHVPGFCTSDVLGSIGDHLDTEVTSVCVMITSGRPVLYVSLAPDHLNEAEVVTTADDMRKLAAWMLTAAAMADEAHAYLPAGE